ncbi:methyltransferase domain-containing protein [Flavobacterium sp. D11R37]|uniref:class I SAM-dependent methyltransferase n=1 Tax=Flavobacterium coralii TaxID=2838017 RepID=UPI001CA61987|nr:class I SAM-dependent methyltransferase [Flavobacterium coralii]MBY8963939.1 methyltransferase domain-containing protein [Flavobacterium coralii]
MKDNFSALAKEYSKYRPAYPNDMVAYILSFVKEKNCALDVATGNGQVAALFSTYFKEIYATDISSKQLEHAVSKDNIFYSRQPAEATDFNDKQFDLITVAQAIHWFDFDVFYKEAYRIMKPEGVIAVMGYGLLQTNSESDKIISRFYHDIVGPYWDAERRYLDENYKTIPFPFNEIYTDRNFVNTFTWDFEQLAGYLQTWSAVQHYKEEKGKNSFSLIEEELKISWENSDKQVTFPLLLRIGKL